MSNKSKRSEKRELLYHVSGFDKRNDNDSMIDDDDEEIEFFRDERHSSFQQQSLLHHHSTATGRRRNSMNGSVFSTSSASSSRSTSHHNRAHHGGDNSGSSSDDDLDAHELLDRARRRLSLSTNSSTTPSSSPSHHRHNSYNNNNKSLEEQSPFLQEQPLPQQKHPYHYPYYSNNQNDSMRSSISQSQHNHHDLVNVTFRDEEDPDEHDYQHSTSFKKRSNTGAGCCSSCRTLFRARWCIWIGWAFTFAIIALLTFFLGLRSSVFTSLRRQQNGNNSTTATTATTTTIAPTILSITPAPSASATLLDNPTNLPVPPTISPSSMPSKFISPTFTPSTSNTNNNPVTTSSVTTATTTTTTSTSSRTALLEWLLPHLAIDSRTTANSQQQQLSAPQQALMNAMDNSLTSSPQWLAFQWLQRDLQLNDHRLFSNPHQVVQRYILAVLYFSFQLPLPATTAVAATKTTTTKSLVTMSWLSLQSECTQWYGITCWNQIDAAAASSLDFVKEGRIKSIQLPPMPPEATTSSTNPQRTLPSELSLLSPHLETLHLSHFDLVGWPVVIPSLRRIDLSYNRLGTTPENNSSANFQNLWQLLAQMPQLEFIDLSNNQLVTNNDQQQQPLSDSLITLNLQNNPRLTGSLNDILPQQTTVSTLVLVDTQIKGSLDEDLYCNINNSNNNNASSLVLQVDCDLIKCSCCCQI